MVFDIERYFRKSTGFNKHHGLFWNRPFHIVSQMASHRYLDLNGKNAVIKSPNGSNS
jgi:hypothetical protein